jgi:hypothetical protein
MVMTPEYFEHDLDAIREQRDLLRSALVGLVGVDGRAELEQMEAMMRLMPAPAEDKAATIDAIHALVKTLESAQPVDAVARAAANQAEPSTREKSSFVPSPSSQE